MTVESRGTSNTNDRGSAESRRRRKNWLLEVFGADVDVVTVDELYELVDTLRRESVLQWSTEIIAPGPEKAAFVLVHKGLGRPACRCFRCGKLVTFETMEVDRIVPGCQKTKKYPNGGTYARENIRPICPDCNKTISGEFVRRRNAQRKRRNEAAKLRRAKWNVVLQREKAIADEISGRRPPQTIADAGWMDDSGVHAFNRSMRDQCF